MASRKIPLAENPNAANSPCRGPTASKRARAHTIDLENDVSPPKKKHITDASYNAVSKAAGRAAVEESIAVDRAPARPMTGFHKRLMAERDARQATQQASKQPDKAVDKTVRVVTAETEALQTWKRHYRRTFPQFCFYLESLPSDAALRLGRQSTSLGARVEKFFSKDVTHVVTTRPVPAVTDSRSSGARTGSQRVETIDPSVLNKADGPARTRNGADLLQRRVQTAADKSASNDVLHKAREMGIKIWTLEKFERMMATLFSHEGSEHDELQTRRHAVPSVVPMKRDRDADLSQLLRNERNNAPVDKKPWQEIIPFRGMYLYVHDMDERTKPVMVREYAKPAKKEEGKWPMFRSVSKGRCPFIEEQRPPSQDGGDTRPRVTRQQQKTVKPTRSAVQERTAALDNTRQAPRTRAATQSPQKEKPILREANDAGNQMPKPQLPASMSKPADASKLQRQTSGGVSEMPPMLGSTHANYQGLPRKPGGEPLASGMQGNITSAIRSQMYSSTAPSAPGQRVGTTKQQHHMSRRILEKQSGLSNSTLPSSFNVNDVRAALNKDQPIGSRRNTRMRATEKLTKIHEDETMSEDEGELEDARMVRLVKRRAPVRRDPKPGYCENCRDKYDDFHEHIVSKQHRKFAVANENFADLDKLLRALTRK